jgi:hypothetical protein
MKRTLKPLSPMQSRIFALLEMHDSPQSAEQLSASIYAGKKLPDYPNNVISAEISAMHRKLCFHKIISTPKGYILERKL